jgi:hypothetical protein
MGELGHGESNGKNGGFTKQNADFTMVLDLTIKNMDLSGQNVGFAHFYSGIIGIEPMKNGFSLRIVNGFCAGKMMIIP